MANDAFGVQNALKNLSNPAKAEVLGGFFKSGKGEYGEGDIFLGITVPQTRGVAMEFSKIGLEGVQSLIKSKIHEERLCGFLILVHKFKKGDEAQRKEIFDFYVSNARCANNWNLVDLSADKIFGKFLSENTAQSKKAGKRRYEFARSENLWERRIAIVSTYASIKKRKF